MTCDKLHMTHGVRWTFSQKLSSLALKVCHIWYFEDLEENDDLFTLLTKWINDKAVCRTDPATLGLLLTQTFKSRQWAMKKVIMKCRRVERKKIEYY